MKQILLFGAGRSATSLIAYLLENSEEINCILRIVDLSQELAEAKIAGHSRGRAESFDITDPELRAEAIKEADVVISLLPPSLHQLIAEDCLRLGKHLATASYVSKDLRKLEMQILQKNLVFLCELGLDPGIDHMTAMQLINKVQEQGGKIESFKSYTGGLISPQSDNNPWHYKFTWNPRNVVIAGQGEPVRYIHQGHKKFRPYQRLFAETHPVHILGWGALEGYPNRNSIYYKELYKLVHTETILRATLRHPGFSRAWNIFVQLGLTDDSYLIDPSGLSPAAWLRSYLPEKSDSIADIEEAFAHAFRLSEQDPIIEQFHSINMFSKEDMGLHALQSPAQILQKQLEKYWSLLPEDQDMIVMQHELIYRNSENKRLEHVSSMVSYGKNAQETAMSYLVGLPLAIGVKHLLLGNIKEPGIHIPIQQAVYEPILRELEERGAVSFHSEERELD